MDEHAPPVVSVKQTQGRAMKTIVAPKDRVYTTPLASSNEKAKPEVLEKKIEKEKFGETYYEGFVGDTKYLVPESNLEGMKDLINLIMRPRKSTKFKHQTSFESLQDFVDFGNKFKTLINKIDELSISTNTDISYLTEDEELKAESIDMLIPNDLTEDTDSKVFNEQSVFQKESSSSHTKELMTDITQNMIDITSEVSKEDLGPQKKSTIIRKISEDSQDFQRSLISQWIEEPELCKIESITSSKPKEYLTARKIQGTIIIKISEDNQEFKRRFSGQLVLQPELYKICSISSSKPEEDLGVQKKGAIPRKISEKAKASQKRRTYQLEKEPDIHKIDNFPSRKPKEDFKSRKKVTIKRKLSEDTQKFQRRLTINDFQHKPESIPIKDPKPMGIHYRFLISGHFKKDQSKPIFIVQQYNREPSPFKDQSADFISCKSRKDIDVNIAGKFFTKSILEESSNGKLSSLKINNESILIDEGMWKVFENEFEDVIDLNSLELVVRGKFIKGQTANQFTPVLSIAFKDVSYDITDNEKQTMCSINEMSELHNISYVSHLPPTVLKYKPKYSNPFSTSRFNNLCCDCFGGTEIKSQSSLALFPQLPIKSSVEIRKQYSLPKNQIKNNLVRDLRKGKCISLQDQTIPCDRQYYSLNKMPIIFKARNSHTKNHFVSPVKQGAINDYFTKSDIIIGKVEKTAVSSLCFESYKEKYVKKSFTMAKRAQENITENLITEQDLIEETRNNKGAQLLKQKENMYSKKETKIQL